MRGWCGAGAHRRVVPDEVDRLEELLVEDALEEVLLLGLGLGLGLGSG